VPNNWKKGTIVPLPFRHKLLYIFFGRTFEKLFNIFEKILIKLKISLLGLNHISARTLLVFKESRHMKLFHNSERQLLITSANHYLPTISELKNQVPKLRFKILLIIQQSIAEMVKGLQ